MRSSAAVTLRAFVMLACAVGIPVLAMSGASWSQILKKFQDVRFPAILNLASASTPATSTESSAIAERGRAVEPPVVAPPLPSVPACPRPEASRPVFAATQGGTVPQNAAPADIHEIQQRLQQLGATYYVLESWGNEQQFYRFYCKMAVAGSADYVHCFEATDANPIQAMQQVLDQVENWRGATNGRGNVGS